MTGCPDMKCLALLYSVAEHAVIRYYDDQISIFDSADEMKLKLERLHTKGKDGEGDGDEQQTLSTREKGNRCLCRQRNDQPRNSRPSLPFHPYSHYTPEKYRPQIAGT